MRGIESRFQFVAYKIDKFVFQAKQDVHFLLQGDKLDPQKMNMGLAVRQPLYSKENNAYMGGVEAKISYPLDEQNTDFLFELEIGMEGLFSTMSDAQFDPQVEENLVKHQIPAILFPYLRSAVTGFFVNAGMGSFVFPLVNVQELARQVGQDMSVKLL